MTRIAIFNQKGGVGKTTSVLNIAGALFRSGNPSLLIDMDPQGHLSQIHPQQIGDAGESLFNFYLNNKPLSELVIDWNNIGKLIPAHRQLVKVDSIFGKGPTILNRFGHGLDTLQKEHAYNNVLIDCCPYLGVLSLSALFTADLVIVPIASDYLSLQGAMKVEKTLTAIEPFLKKQITRRYLITRYDKRRNMSSTVREQAIAAFGGNVLDTLVYENVATAESPNQKQDIFSFNVHSVGAVNYSSLLDELISQNLVNTEPSQKPEPGANADELVNP